MSGEHLWSDWMAKSNLLPRGGEYIEFKSTFKGRHKDAANIFKRTRQGTANTKKIKVVCHDCNNGWMSSLETDARPHLTQLITGDHIVLTDTVRMKIAEWVVMKVLVAEHSFYFDHPADPIFDQKARAEFRESRTIPAHFRIWIALQNGTKWVTGFHRYATGLGLTATLPPPPLRARTKNVQTVTWGIGKLLIYLNAVTDPAVHDRLELKRMEPLLGLWPLTSADVVWPPRFFVKDAYIDKLSMALEEFVISGNVILP
jgi:hypothetical protein